MLASLVPAPRRVVTETSEFGLDQAGGAIRMKARPFPYDFAARLSQHGGMNFMPTARSLYSALVIAVAAWVLHGFVEAMLAACIIAIASWPLYRRFAARMPRGMDRAATSLVFTSLMALFVLAPLMFAFAALVTEAHATMLSIAAADPDGMMPPSWLVTVPLAGPWLAARWTSKLGEPGALAQWAEHADPAAFLSWAQSLGQFTVRHVFIVLFTILLVFFLYQHGESLARALRRALRQRVGGGAERYLDVAGHAVRASVNSMLVVGLFDGVVSWAVYEVAGVPQAALWGAITGALGLVPFLGYVAVVALTLQLSFAGAPATWAFLLGCLVLLSGDKLVRPVMARNGTQLPYVWVLMGCLGGFEVLGLVGLVIGPVALTVSREVLAELSTREQDAPARTAEGEAPVVTTATSAAVPRGTP
jgi:predicted PurR-regulated permease PerM